VIQYGKVGLDYSRGQVAMSTLTAVTVPDVELTLEQLIAAVRQLEPEARSEVARVLLETELDGRMAALIERLARKQPADDVSDADIAREVRAVRDQRRRQCSG
jgi:hypothetical protein